MKISIITSCTGQEEYSSRDQLTQEDFRRLHGPAAFEQREGQLADYRLSAHEMYTGMQQTRLMKGVNAFRRGAGEESVVLWILSSGYGLNSATREIVPYECTFQNMKLTELDQWAAQLKVPTDDRTLFAEPADLVLVLRGNRYLRVPALDEGVRFAMPTLFFAAGSSRRYIQGQGQVRTARLGKAEATRFSCGLVGLRRDS